MDITLYSFSKRANSTKRPSGGVTVSGYLREGADLRSPSFILKIPPDQLSTYMSYNYAKVLGQYYYVGDLVNLSATEWEMSMTLDELATYKSAILNTEAFVLYSTSEYDPMINDSRLDILPTHTTHMVASNPSVDWGTSSVYALTVINNTLQTLATTYLLDSANLATFANRIQDDSFLSTFSQKYAGKFTDYIVSLRYYPFNPVIWYTQIIPELSDAEVMLGSFQGIARGKIINPVAIGKRHDIMLPISELHRGDFRDVHMRRYTLYIPWCGPMELDPVSIGEKNFIICNTRLDVTNGGWHVLVYASNSASTDASKINSDAVILGTTGAQIGSEIPITGVQNNTNMVNGMYAGAASAGALAAYGLKNAAIGVGAAALVSAAGAALGALSAGDMKVPIMIGGQSNSTAPNNVNNNAFTLIVSDQDSRFEPEDIANKLGRPCQKLCKLSDLSGFVQTVNASVGAVAPDDIVNSINTSLDEGIYLE